MNEKDYYFIFVCFILKLNLLFCDLFGILMFLILMIILIGVSRYIVDVIFFMLLVKIWCVLFR